MSDERKPAAQAETATEYGKPPAGIRRDAALWVAALAGPIAWLVQLQASYTLVGSGCQPRQKLLLWMFLLVALAGSAGGGVLANAVRKRWASNASVDEVSAGRIKFMALFALGSSALFTLLILAGAVPVIILRACD